MESDDQTEPRSQRTAGGDLQFLVARGMNEAGLASCDGLAELVRCELGWSEPVSAGTRIHLLGAVLSGLVEEQRQQALTLVKDLRHRESGKQTPFQVAAAGELLRVPDPSATFDAIRDFRCKSLDVSWVELQSKAGKGPKTQAQLQAVLWIGSTSPKTGGRWEAQLVAVLEPAIAAYAQEHRAELRALITDAPDPQAPSVEPPAPLPPTDLPEDEPSPESGGDWKRYGGIAAAVVVVGAVIASTFAVLNDDDSAEGSGTTPTPVSTPSASSPPPPASSDPAPESRTIQDIPACSSLPSNSQWAKELRSRGHAVVDGRCYPDPNLDVGAQTGPARTYPGAAHLKIGQVIEDICLKSGQTTKDMVGSKSSVWVRFKLDENRQAFVSAIWVQGEEGADPC